VPSIETVCPYVHSNETACYYVHFIETVCQCVHSIETACYCVHSIKTAYHYVHSIETACHCVHSLDHLTDRSCSNLLSFTETLVCFAGRLEKFLFDYERFLTEVACPSEWLVCTLHS